MPCSETNPTRMPRVRRRSTLTDPRKRKFGEGGRKISIATTKRAGSKTRMTPLGSRMTKRKTLHRKKKARKGVSVSENGKMKGEKRHV